MTLSLPNLAGFCATIHFPLQNDGTALADCLDRCAEHLIALILLDVDIRGFAVRQDQWMGHQNLFAALKRVQNLVHLTVGWRLLRPSEVLGLEAVVKLAYYSLTQGDTDFLAAGLVETAESAMYVSRPMNLTKLRMLSFDDLGMNFGIESIKRVGMEQACKARGIEVSFDEFMRGALPDTRDLGDLYLNNHPEEIQDFM